MIRKVVRKLYILCFIPVVIFIRLLSPLLLIRVGAVLAHRVGHLALDIEIALCRDETRSRAKKFPRELNLFYTSAQISNRYLLELWKNVLLFLPRNLLEPINLLNQRLPNAVKYDFFYEVKQRGHFDLRALDHRAPHLSFSKEDVERGSCLLRELGILEGEQYVCLAVRDDSYLKETFPGLDYSYHNYRDSNIANYVEMAEYLVSKGLKVLRMGNIVKDPLLSSCPGVIDYANSQHKSDFADVFLFANSAFCITTTTGMDGLATIFRVPIVLVNIVSRGSIFLGDLVRLYQPKSMIDLDSGEMLTFQDKIDRNLFEIHTTSEFEEQKVLLLENNSHDLKRFAEEVYMLMENNTVVSKFGSSLVTQDIYEEFSLEKLSKSWLQNNSGYLT